MRETIYLFKFLFPSDDFTSEIQCSPGKKTKNFKNLSQFFNSSNKPYENNFVNMTPKSTSLPEIINYGKWKKLQIFSLLI